MTNIIIDIHSHLGPMENPWMKLYDPVTLIKLAKQAGIGISVVSSTEAIFSGEFKTQEQANSRLLKYSETYSEILVWWVVDPRDKRSIKSAEKISDHPNVVGFKIHPQRHKYHFKKYAHTIFALAAETNRPILSHCGHIGCMPAEMVNFCNKYPEVRFIIAHFGNCGNHLAHIKAMQKCTSKNVFVDTSSSVSIQRGIIEFGVKEIGANRFLFGSDNPCYHPSAQVNRIKCAELSTSVRSLILQKNAIKYILREENLGN